MKFFAFFMSVFVFVSAVYDKNIHRAVLEALSQGLLLIYQPGTISIK